MTQHWLKKEGHPSLTIFFTGWGMTPATTKHLALPDSDFLVCCDYRSIEPITGTSHYQHINIIAYSMGVWAASLAMEHIAAQTINTIAINGSALPVSDQFGIPETVYNGTHHHLSPSNFQKFVVRICGNRENAQLLNGSFNDADIDLLRQELAFIQTNQAIVKPFRPWHKAIISQNDLIYPCRNLTDYWQTSNTPIELINAPHFPFWGWKSWDDIIKNTQHDNA
jgi:biotin synthesis protein BioG